MRYVSDENFSSVVGLAQRLGCPVHARLLSVTFVLLSLAVLLPTPVALGDSVEINGGGQVVGKSTTKGGMTLVAVDEDLQIAIEDNRVRRVLPSADLAEYQRRAKAAGDNAQAHYELARWCAVPGNVPGMSVQFKRYHWERAIEIDPNHSEARAALRYQLVRGEWIRSSDLNKQRGMVKHKGKLDLPEAIAHRAQQDEYDDAAKQWNRDIRKMVAIIGSGPANKRYAETLTKLEVIADPRASAAVADQLLSSRGKPGGSPTQPRALRQLWVKLLGRFKTGKSVEALVRAGIHEPDQSVRERALDELVRYGSGSAKASYIAILKKNSSHDLVGKAARALSWFPEREMADDYIKALTTTFTRDAPKGPQYQSSFGSINGQNTGGTSSFGSKKKVIKVTERNPAVLALVKQVIPEQDFGYDERAWLEYLAIEKTKYSGDLRRDP